MLSNFNTHWNPGDDASNSHLDGARHDSTQQSLSAQLLSRIDSNDAFAGFCGISDEVRRQRSRPERHEICVQKNDLLQANERREVS